MKRIFWFKLILFFVVTVTVLPASGLLSFSSPEIPFRSHQEKSPLDLRRVEEWIASKLPDSALATEIEERGVLFNADADLLKRLQKSGAGPLTIDALKESRIRVSIVSVTKLSPKTGTGLGYEILLKNDYLQELIVASTEITGVYELSFHGLTTVIHRVVYEVELDSALPDATGINSTLLKGKVYDSTSQDWGIRCEGRFKFNASTDKGHKLWEYSLSVPSVARIPSRDLVFLRILFKRGVRRILEEKAEDSTAASVTGSVIKNSHHLIIKLQGGPALKVEIDEDFFRFLVKWDN